MSSTLEDWFFREPAIATLYDFLDPNKRSELMYQLLRRVSPRIASSREIQELLKRLDSSRDGTAVLETAKAILDTARLLDMGYDNQNQGPVSEIEPSE
jgi:hypothetical protein